MRLNKTRHIRTLWHLGLEPEIAAPEKRREGNCKGEQSEVLVRLDNSRGLLYKGSFSQSLSWASFSLSVRTQPLL